MADLAVLVPSRGRPHNIERLNEAMAKTCRGDTELIVGLDDDDPTYDAYWDLMWGPSAGGWTIVSQPDLRGRLVEWLNRMAVAEVEDSAKFVGHIGDDNLPQTDGWDVRIMESLERQGDIGFCFANDLDPGRPPGSLSIHIFMTAEVVRRLGYMGPPSIQHMYVDPTWFAWGTATSIEFLEDVHIPHLHYSLGHAPMDESYHHSTGLIPEDCARYNDYCEDPAGMNADIVKLGGRPFSAEAMAEFNARLNIPRRWA